MVTFVETEEGVLISLQEITAADTLERIGEFLSDKDIILEELIESGREVRSDLIEDEYA